MKTRNEIFGERVCRHMFDESAEKENEIIRERQNYVVRLAACKKKTFKSMKMLNE
jgi:hypothetical protein